MKRVMSLLLAAVLCLSVTACGNKKVPENQPEEICVRVKNTVKGVVSSLGAAWYIGEESLGSTGMQAAGGGEIGGEITFVLTRDDVPADADLKQFGMKISVTELSGAEFDVSTLYFPVEFGKEYGFELRDEGGCYAVWAEMDHTLYDGGYPIGAEGTVQSVDLTGPWHLDSEKNDLALFENSLELFPGYGEWGASMEIRSNGLMSWYIGAESWHGNYAVDGETLHAQLTSDLEQVVLPWDFRIVAEDETLMLEMDYKDMTIFWTYGDREDLPAAGEDPEVYVDRQGTDTVYSSLTLTPDRDGYFVEMGIYRLTTFYGTAKEADGVLYYTDNDLAVQGIILREKGGAVFEVTESDWEPVQKGERWAFPER